MTLDELKKDLNFLCPINEFMYDNTYYFDKKILSTDLRVYRRRTFKDLFRRYRPKGVTEKLLMRALYECKFCSYLCEDIDYCVFFKWEQNYKFWHYEKDRYQIKSIGIKTGQGKYNMSYLQNLYDSIYK